MVIVEVLVLTFSVPFTLFCFLLLLERFESSLLDPGERAVRVAELLHASEDPDQVEAATARMLERVAPSSADRHGQRG